MRRAGDSGEREVLNYLQESLYHLPSYILHNFHVRIPNQFAIQIDYLVLTSNYILMIEVKNIRGRITFKSNPAQMIRELNGELLAMDCPFAQLDRNLLHFKKLIGTVPLPIYSIVVWANRSAIIEQMPAISSHKLLFIKQLPNYLNQLEHLPKQQIHLRSLVNRLKSKATPFYSSSLCERHGIEVNELLPGLICLSCYTHVVLHAKTWVCPRCKLKRNDMVSENILLLFDLLGPDLQLSQLREILPFLKYRNLKKLLLSGELRSLNQKKNKKYSLNRKMKVEWIEINKI